MRVSRFLVEIGTLSFWGQNVVHHQAHVFASGFAGIALAGGLKTAEIP